MRQNGYLRLFLLVILVQTVSALPGFSQAAQGRTPAPKTPAEFTAYTAAYNEKDPAKKAELAEKFITEFKDSELLSGAYSMVISGSMNSKNWAKAMESADKVSALSGVDDKTKKFAYENALMAANNENNIDKVLSYGDKVLAMDPNNLNTLVTVSTAIPIKYPTNKDQLNIAADMAAKALAGLQPVLAQASGEQKKQIALIDGTLHDVLGVVAYNNQDYMKSMQNYQTAIQDNMKDDNAHFYLAYNYLALMAQASKAYQAAFKAETDAIAAKADQPTVDDLKARTAGTIEELKKQQEKAIDELAIAAAIGGPYAQEARTELQKQWMNKNSNTDGMDQFVADKKGQLRQ
jgi:hypothetical protein